jgi:hypothetical protein
MDTSKSKLNALGSKTKTVKLGASTSGDKKSPLAKVSAKKDYSKNKKVDDFGTTGFGQTGLTGES